MELVFAVDVSGSVDSSEFNLQRDGYAQAFQDTTLQNAIIAKGGIAVTYVYWSGSTEQQQATPWTLVNSAASANTFALAIGNSTRPYSGLTGIGAAISFSSALFADNGFEGNRLVIDISGDGTNNTGPSPTGARDAAVAQRRTINGLPILSSVATLGSYYTNNVIGGLGAFVEVAANYSTFQPALLAKLSREVNESPSAQPEPGTYLLMATGLIVLGCLPKRRRRR
ncbi:MAG: DUF1194 domain-containing protein [bacterium]|nr:DUF1194 domain-containing protein [bacterium]